MKYRADIDGLRAIAVLAVVFYHLGFTSFFASGYIGVDIFFVISGYLITKIIYKEMLENSFSFLDFYERRIRRIFPVFLFVLLATLLCAHFIAFYDMRNFIDSLFSALIMGGNFYFWQDLNYFSLPSHMKPLLHTWSLGVEEQFYLIFPLILLFLVKRKFSPLLVLSILWLISFGICIMQSNSTADTAFYLLPYRLWELLTGSILAIYGIQGKDLFKNSTQVHLATILAIILLIFSINYLKVFDASFPSFLPIFACLATSLCIAIGNTSANTKNYFTKILSFPLLTFIGKISFSLYLWHWVVIVFAREIIFLESHKLPLEQAFSCLAISFALSIFSYFVIEQPIRKKRILTNRKHLFIAMFALSAFIALLALAMKEEIIPSNMSEDTKYYKSIKSGDYEINFAEFTFDVPELKKANILLFGDISKEPTLFVMGDSHAEMLYFVLDFLAKEHKVSGIFYSSHTYRFFHSLRHGDGDVDNAIENTKILKEYLGKFKNIKALYLSSRWLENVQYFEINSKEIIEDGRLVREKAILEVIDFFEDTKPKVFIKPITPTFSFNTPQRAAKAVRQHPKTSDEFRKLLAIPHSRFLENTAQRQEELEEIQKKRDFELIDFNKKICDDEYCYAVTQEGTLIICDDNHFSREGAMLFQEELLPFILAGKE